MQVMADDELTFPFRKWSLFENLERSGDRIKLDPAMMRADVPGERRSLAAALRRRSGCSR